MNKQLLFIILIAFFTTNLWAQNVNIPDANFKAFLLANTSINTNGDGEIDVSEAANSPTFINCNDLDIADLTGIEAFVNLTGLTCNGNMLTSLDLSQNLALGFLSCRTNQLTSLNVAQNTALTSLSCQSNLLEALDVSQNINLELLNCENNDLMTLDVSNNTLLTLLRFNNNDISTIDVTNNTELLNLYCSGNNLTTIDISQNIKLTALLCQENSLTNLDVGQNSDLSLLWCSSNQITTLDVSELSLLTNLQCANNQLTSLDISQNPLLETLRCELNEIEFLDFSQKPILDFVGISSCNIQTLDFSEAPLLRYLNCAGNSDLTYINLANDNNINIEFMQAVGCPELVCIQVDNTIDLNDIPTDWSASSGVIYSYDCGCTITTNLSETVCDSYTSPSGQLINISGIYSDTIMDSSGCDTIFIIDLTVNYSTSSTIDVESCDSYTSPSGIIYPKSGTYEDVILNAAGCDSVITINLTYFTIDVSVSQSGNTLSANQSGSIYQWLDCDAEFAQIPDQSLQDFTADIAGNYAVEITLNGCVDTSDCFPIIISGVAQNYLDQIISVSPNPTNGLVRIQLNQDYADVKVSVLNVVGQAIQMKTYNNTNAVSIDFEGNPGVYFISITTDNEQWSNIKILKK